MRLAKELHQGKLEMPCHPIRHHQASDLHQADTLEAMDAAKPAEASGGAGEFLIVFGFGGDSIAAG